MDIFKLMAILTPTPNIIGLNKDGKLYYPNRIKPIETSKESNSKDEELIETSKESNSKDEVLIETSKESNSKDEVLIETSPATVVQVRPHVASLYSKSDLFIFQVKSKANLIADLLVITDFKKIGLIFKLSIKTDNVSYGTNEIPLNRIIHKLRLFEIEIINQTSYTFPFYYLSKKSVVVNTELSLPIVYFSL